MAWLQGKSAANRWGLNLVVELPPCFRLWGVVPQNALHLLAIVVGVGPSEVLLDRLTFIQFLAIVSNLFLNYVCLWYLEF
jgi:hypothetical protein